jgi:galactose mutarotase-like enzyme
MIYTLENEFFKVSISTKGAELQSVFSKKLGVELLWQGDATFWGKRSPILFPIVGSLKNGEYEYQNKKYKLSRHGFARDMEFKCTTAQSTIIKGTEVSFTLTQTEETLQQYPFEFEFEILYTLLEDSLMVNTKVLNTSTSSDLYASFGAHPAFNLPIFPSSNFEDYSLVFSKNEEAGVYPLTETGLIKTEQKPFFENENKLQLSKELFYGDALVFKDLKSDSIKVVHNDTKKGFQFVFVGDYDYFGIWSAKDAPFICLEPWAGIADTENSNGKLVNKEGIIRLLPNEESSAMWSINALYF